MTQAETWLLPSQITWVPSPGPTRKEKNWSQWAVLWLLLWILMPTQTNKWTHLLKKEINVMKHHKAAIKWHFKIWFHMKYFFHWNILIIVRRKWTEKIQYLVSFILYIGDMKNLSTFRDNSITDNWGQIQSYISLFSLKLSLLNVWPVYTCSKCNPYAGILHLK